MRPTLKGIQSREDLFKIYDRLGLFSEYHSLQEVETILLERGDLLSERIITPVPIGC
jgi:hypothetical protein